MRWVALVACLFLVSAAEAGRWRQGKVSWYAGKSGYVAARRGLARKGDRVVIARPDSSRSKRFRVCCQAKLRPGRAFDLARSDFRRYALPSRGETGVRYRIERSR